MANSPSNREVDKLISLKLSEYILLLIYDTPEFFQIFWTNSFGDIRGIKLNLLIFYFSYSENQKFALLPHIIT